MSLDPEVLHKWINANGPFLEYRGVLQVVPWLRRDGVLPPTITGASQSKPIDEMAGRPNHVYLGTRTAGENAMVGMLLCRVDLRRLDPRLMDSNEDQVGAHNNISVSHLPRANELPPRHQGETGGEWADRHYDIVDLPEWVAFALHGGSIAYRGTVGRDALRFPPEILAEWKKAAAGDPYAPRKHVSPMPYERLGSQKALALSWHRLLSRLR